MTTAFVHGFAVTGRATAAALAARGYRVVVSDDRIDDGTLSAAAEIGVDVVPVPDDLERFVASFDLVCPAPGVPESHAVVVAARRQQVEIVSEIELAYRWEQQRPGGPRPVLAVTGTDGKTTTVELVTAVLGAAGRHAVAVGNTEIPMVSAVDDDDVDVFVVECTSFRLAWTDTFRAEGAVWLNLAPDHLDWHRSMESYSAAKERIFRSQRPDDVSIGFAGDPVVAAAVGRSPARHRTFGTDGADYRESGGMLIGPAGAIVDIESMSRRLPHDITNALAASALVLETGLADPAAIRRALRSFTVPPHRIEPVGTLDGVGWYDDSKATTPHAAAAAIRSFDSVVLIAGGSRKGVDLAPMTVDSDRIRAVVAIGDAAPDVEAAFADSVPVVLADSMTSAVTCAAGLAERGDVVLLSPGCASFDWYSGYAARGDDFSRSARALIDAAATPNDPAVAT